MTDHLDPTLPQNHTVPVSPTCPLCHTRDLGMTSHALNEGASWRCTRCGQRWTAERLATAAAYTGA